MPESVVIADDEVEIADLIELYLKNEGYEVRKFYNGTDALRSIMKDQPDLALLDVMLPDTDGFTLLQKIRQHYYFPVIMLTARVEDIDKIKGLALGADDYITKPFNPLEMVARVKTQLRRSGRYNRNATGQATDDRTEIEFNGLSINTVTHSARLYDEELHLTPIEFSILWYLGEHRGQVVTSEDLFTAVWGEEYLESTNTVMAHIGRLREKMHEQPRHPKFIKTVWGVGYKID